MMIRNIFILAISIILTSCSVFSPVKSDYTTYVLRIIPCETRYATRNITLFVTPVEADPLYESDNMAYSTHPYQVEYYAKNKWAETPANLFKPLMIKTLRDTHHFRAVTTSQNVAQYQYVLNTRIIELRQVFSGCTSYVVFRLNVEIVNAKTRKIIASREFRSTHMAYARTPYAGVLAANKCVADVLNELAIFSVRHT